MKGAPKTPAALVRKKRPPMSDDLTTLRRCAEFYRQTIPAFQDIAMHYSAHEKRTMLMRLWQTQIKCMSEVEWQIRQQGGELSAFTAPVLTAQSLKNYAEPLLRDRKLLLDCLNEQTQLLYQFSEIRKSPHPFDTRMLIQRHQIIAHETMEHLLALEEELHAIPVPADSHAAAVLRTACLN